MDSFIYCDGSGVENKPLGCREHEAINLEHPSVEKYDAKLDLCNQRITVYFTSKL
jgi:hypothetical protein